MNHLLEHLLGLQPGELLRHNNTALHVISALVLTGREDTAREVIKNPTLVTDKERLGRALHDALKPKSATQQIQDRILPPKPAELRTWRKTHGDGIRYLGQPKR
ncbi:MAG: hypothetical protein HYY87_01065 [Candidatus Levybacteria bacterium]|nr:hypothetical protein [Candidatus Levybacteria bacterium]MBI3093153.1 hypothetical protein [Candidatus Levybacteria bacterium]